VIISLSEFTAIFSHQDALQLIGMLIGAITLIVSSFFISNNIFVELKKSIASIFCFLAGLVCLLITTDYNLKLVFTVTAFAVTITSLISFIQLAGFITDGRKDYPYLNSFLGIVMIVFASLANFNFFSLLDRFYKFKFATTHPEIVAIIAIILYFSVFWWRKDAWAKVKPPVFTPLNLKDEGRCWRGDYGHDDDD
jgi:hypothetical protein